ncbi:MAG: SurA N-terminal domain-containing protein [Bacteroidia bacterium]|nr:SurA N-terminal domain-containing protein [Bacteroidia bacterium]MCZ2276657.1 SurA N-terminal domain-containing protein [Bacteroidia bacterium]
MAVIGKIRNQAALLIGIVGFSLLAFILGDLLTSNRSFLTGSDTTVGIIGGKKIKIQDFEGKVNELEVQYKINNNKDNVDQNTLEQLRNQAWGDLLNEQLLGKQYSKTGLFVSPEEVFDMVQGKNVHPQIKEAFKDPKTGEFNPANVVQFLKNMDNDQTGRTRWQWVNFEKAITKERLSQKFDALVKGGLYVTTQEAKRQYENTQRLASIRFINIPYASMPDSTFHPTDSELSNYIKENASKYQQDATRKIEYVVFEVVPSAEDRAAAESYISNLIDAFRNAVNDSAFVAEHSDLKPTTIFNIKGTLAPRLDSVMFDAPLGTVIGPYEEGGYFKAAKLSEIRNAPDSVKVSHILVSFAGAERSTASRTKEEAKAIADSLFKLCEKDNTMYLDFAKNQSDDKASAEKEGDLGWITMSSPMDERFKAGAFDIPQGGVNVVESNFGFHIIKVFDATKPVKQVHIAYLDRQNEASQKTYNAVYSRVNEFAGKNNTAEQFDKACTDQGLDKRVVETLTENEKNIPGLENPRELVRWAFQAKKNEVSKAYEFDNKFVVAKLDAIRTKGTSTVDDVRTSVTESYIKELKGKQIVENLNKYIAEGAKNLDEIGAKSGYTAQPATGLSFASPYIVNIGMEPDLAGAVFASKQGELSKPVVGENGVFVFIVDQFTEPNEKTDFAQDKKSQTQNLGARANYEVFNALKEKAKVEDRRGKFY